MAAHSSTSMHDLPSPVQPLLQVQSNDPTRLVQEALASQSSEPSKHSSTSSHCIVSEFLANPALQSHLKLPDVLTQAELSGQTEASSHSLISTQRSSAIWKPVLQVITKLPSVFSQVE